MSNARHLLGWSAVHVSHVALATALLHGCTQSSLELTTAASTASVAPPATSTAPATPQATAQTPASLTLGVGEYWARDSRTAFGTFAGVSFPACLSNTSAQPLWYYAQWPKDPWVRKWVHRPGSDAWTDETFRLCGLGVKLHQLAPGEAVTFKSSVSIDQVGGCLRIEIPLYAGPSAAQASYLASSSEVPIQ